MKWIEAKVTFDSGNLPLATELISDVFYTLDLKGVVVEDPFPEITDGLWDEAQKMPDTHAVIGYFPKDDFMVDKCRDLEGALGRLRTVSGILSVVTYREIDEEDWAESWKVYFWPEKIGETIVVKPTWRDYSPQPGEIVIEIDPGMAFGAGNHPTTALCIRMIEAYMRPRARILDVGTGSGILMAVAAKLGADVLWGVDTDAIAVEIARENLVLNHISEDRFTLVHGSLQKDVDLRFDLIVANILSEVIIDLLPGMKALLEDDGVMICSGIIEINKDSVLREMARNDLEIIEGRSSENWVAIVARKQPLKG